jgi:Protein kinase domain
MTQFQDRALQEGFHIGVYEIKNILSANRFDITYRGWNHHLNIPVVLKEYFPHDLAERGKEAPTVVPKSEQDRSVYESGLASFVEQAETLGQIEQPSIVGVHNVLQTNGTAYLIMDYEDGVPLSSRADPQSSLTGSELRAILGSLLAGLEQVHIRGTIHGDIHPSNILLRGNGEPVLIDFAASKLTVAERSNRLAQELRAGYAAPEQYDPSNPLRPESDLYSLGATMYRCITHYEPVPAPERLSAINKSKTDMLKTLSRSSSRVDNDDALLETIASMLRPKAKDRAHSAAELLSALSREDEAVQGTGTKSSDGERKAKAIELPGSAHETQPVEPPRRASVWAGIVIGAAALIGAGLWYFRSSEPVSDPVAQQSDSRPTLASKAKQADAVGGTIRSADPERRSVEAAGEADTEAMSESARHEAPEPRLETAAMDKKPAEKTIAKAQSTTRPLATADDPETSASTPHSEPTADSSAANGAKTTATAVTAKPPSQATTAAESKSPSAGSTAAQSARQQATPKPAADDDTIQSHLTAAEEAVTALRLTTPPENNAYRHYQAVLALDPENAEAQAGIQRIVDMYVWFIDRAIAKRRFRRATIYLARAEAISPNAPNLQRVRTKLYKAKK